MVINWYGEGAFKVQTGGQTVSVDPFSNGLGLAPPRFTATLTVRTLLTLPLKANDGGEHEAVGPGDYEFDGIELSGFPLESSEGVLKTAYALTAEGLRLGFLGHLAKSPEPTILEDLGSVDILFAPAGGAPFMALDALAKLIKQINPKLIVPSFYKVPGLTRKAGPVDAFVKELGIESDTVDKLTVKKKDLPPRMRASILTP
jgi:L-ascorbate metabolism protein UlaG (beta-lactamase superfamily)